MAMLNTAPDGVIVVDEAGAILEFNPAAERIFGRRQEDVFGKRVVDVVIPPDDRKRFGYLSRRLQQGRAARLLGQHVEMQVLRADGELVPVELAITEIRHTGRRLFVAYVRDLTERKRTEHELAESLARYRFLADAMPQNVWTADAAGSQDYVNRRWVEYTGIGADDGSRNRWAEIVHPDDREAMCKLGVAPAQVHLIPGSGVDTDTIKPLPEPDGDVTAAFVGRLLDDKGVRPLVEAQALLTGHGETVRLLIAGDRDPANPASIPAEEVESWKRRPGVELLGHVTGIEKVWARAHIAVLPSRREGLPKSLLEAAAFGRPSRRCRRRRRRSRKKSRGSAETEAPPRR